MRHPLLLPSLLGLLLSACPREATVDAAGDSGHADARLTNGNRLQAIVQRGTLRVVLPPRGQSFLPRAGTPLDSEQQLAELLAAELGVTLQVMRAPDHAQLLSLLQGGRADIVVASLTITAERQRQIAFSRPLSTVYEVLVGSAAQPTIDGISQLAGKTVHVRRSSAFYDTLKTIQPQAPGLEIELADEAQDTLALLEQVSRGRIALTVADSNLLRAAQGFVPNIHALLRLGPPRQTAWALPRDAPALKRRVDRFIERQALAEDRPPLFTGDLDGIKKRGVLRVLTRNNAIHFWLHRGQLLGFDYELAEALAKKIGVRLEIVVPPSRRDLIPWLVAGRGDVIAAGLTTTAARKQKVDFAAAYLSAREVVVTASSTTIHRPQDLAGREVWVQASSSYAETLKELSNRLPQPIKLRAVDEDEEFDQTLAAVVEGRYPVSVVDSHLAAFEQARGLDLQVGPALSEARDLAWATRKSSPRLRQAISAFFTQGDFKPRGLRYNMLHRRYFEQLLTADSHERELRAGHISPYDSLLKQAARETQIDWRLLAAQMYQESRFDPRARSWVGARGLMQIMPATARELGIEDPEDPRQSILAGARYLRQMAKRFEPTLPERERIRFALASYNAGYGHVADARRLAARLKRDPDRWSGHVEYALLQLQKPRYARRARYGYCRGREPVDYVARILDRFQRYSRLRP